MKQPKCGHALDVWMARDTLRRYPSHIAKMVANSNTQQQDLFDVPIRASVRKLFRAALLINPKRMAA